MQSEASSSKAEATTAKERPSGKLYTATAHTTTLSARKEKLIILTPIREHASISFRRKAICAYIGLELPVEIAATKRGKIYAYYAGYLGVGASWC